MLAGLGVASAAAITALTPASAKAHWGGGGWGSPWGNGWGGWGGCNDPEDVVYGLLGALETMDAEEITSWLHDDVVYQNTGLPEILGTEAVAQFISGFAGIFESLTVDVVSIMSHGNLVCTERIEHFVVAQDSPVGYPGAELTVRAAGWHQIQNGKMIRWSDYWDTRVYSAVLGVPLPMP